MERSHRSDGRQSSQKFGTVQITGVYMTPASSYPLQEFFMRNIDVKHGQAPDQFDAKNL